MKTSGGCCRAPHGLGQWCYRAPHIPGSLCGEEVVLARWFGGCFLWMDARSHMRVWKRTYACTIRITYAYTYHTHKKGHIENATLKCSKISYFLFQTQNLIFFLYNFLLEIFVFFSRYKYRKSLQIHTCPRTSQTDVWWWEIQARSLGGQREASRCVCVCVCVCVCFFVCVLHQYRH